MNHPDEVKTWDSVPEIDETNRSAAPGISFRGCPHAQGWICYIKRDLKLDVSTFLHLDAENGHRAILPQAQNDQTAPRAYLAGISRRTTSLALSISPVIVDAVELTLLFTLLKLDAPVFDFLPLLTIMWSPVAGEYQRKV